MRLKVAFGSKSDQRRALMERLNLGAKRTYRTGKADKADLMSAFGGKADHPRLL